MDQPRGIILSEYSTVTLLDQKSSFSYGDQSPMIRYFKHHGRFGNKSQYGDLKITRLNNQYSVVSSEYDIQLISHDLTTSGEVKVQEHEITNFSRPVINVHSNWPMSNSISLTVVIFQNQIVLYSIDAKAHKLLRKSQHKVFNVDCISFVNSSNFYLVTDASYLWEFDCSDFTLALRHKVLAKLEATGQYGKITNCAVFAQFSSVEDYPIYVLYSAKVQDQIGDITETLLVKEFARRHQKLEQGELFVIRQCQQTFSGTFQVVQHRKAICLVLQEEIIIINKQHNSYYILDNIRKKDLDSKMILFHDGMLFTISESKIEKAKLSIEASDCKVNLLDMIHFSCPGDHKFLGIAAIQQGYLVYLQKTGSSVVMYASTKMVAAIQKLVMLTRHYENVKQVQLLGQRLGINRQTFYSQLWQHSDKTVEDIRSLLFSTRDPVLIKTKLIISLRHKKIRLYDLTLMFQDIQTLLKSQLTKTMETKLLKDYIRCNFMLRKLKIQPEPSNVIGYNQYVEIKNKSILTLMTEAMLGEKFISHMTMRERSNTLKHSPFRYQSIMKDILAEFRHVLLDNYQNDLIELLRTLSEDIPYIINRFSYLLPNYPYKFQFKTFDQLRIEVDNSQIAQKGQEVSGGIRQPKLFCAVKEPGWEQQVSIASIIQFYSQYHPTSLIESKIQEVLSAYNFDNERLQRHGLIKVSKKEYIHNCNQMSGINLYLAVCQYANAYNVTKLAQSKKKQRERREKQIEEQRTKSLEKTSHRRQTDNNENMGRIVFQESQIDSLPGSLVDRLQTNNKLAGEDLHKCRFYARMHLLLLKNRVDSNITMDRVVSLSDQDLIALFFLGNRSKLSMLYQEVKQIYDQFVTSQGNMFYKAIANFVKSDNCSPVELGFLTESLNERGRDFQEQNQQLISILVDGFAMRYCVYETSKIHELINRKFHDIFLNQSLNQRMIRILKISELSQFLELFNCQEEKLINVEMEGHIMLSRILENYFTGSIRGTDITICEQKVNLLIPRNMLNVMLYLAEELYQLSQMDVLLIFGDRLIDYSVFNVLMELISEDETMAMLGVDPSEFSQMLINEALEKIFEDKDLKDFSKVQSHLQSILKLRKQETPEYLSKEAEVRLCRLVSSYNSPTFSYSPYMISHITDVQEFVAKLIQSCYQQLSLDHLIEIYKCFKVINFEEDALDEYCIGYISFWTKTLLKNKLTQKGLVGVKYLIEKGFLHELYELTTECLIQVITSRYGHKGDIGMAFVQYYVLNYNRKDDISNMFQSNFSLESIIELHNQRESIKIHPSLMYLDIRKQYITLHSVASLIQNKSPSQNTEQFYREYHFLMSIIFDPEIGFQIKGIYQDYKRLEDLIQLASSQLLIPKMTPKKITDTATQGRSSHVSKVVNFNEYQFRFMFFKGLVRTGCSLMQITPFQVNMSANLDQQTLGFVKFCNELKTDHPELHRVLKRSQKYLQENYQFYINKTRKVESYKRELLEERELEIRTEKKLKKELQDLHARSFTDQTKLDRTMPLKEYLREVQNLSSMYFPAIPQREVMSMVWVADRSPSPTRERRSSPQERKVDLMITVEEEENKNNLILESIETLNLDDLDKLSTADQLKLLESYYQTRVTNESMGKFLNLLQQLKLGEPYNIGTVKNACRLVTSFQFTTLFPFEFYFYQSGGAQNTYEHFQGLLKFLQPRIRSVINEDNDMTISKIIYNCYKPFNKELEYQVYLIAFSKLVEGLDILEGTSINTFDDYIRKMSASATFISKNYDHLLAICWKAKDEFKETLVNNLQNNLGFQGTSASEKVKIQELLNRIQASSKECE